MGALLPFGAALMGALWLRSITIQQRHISKENTVILHPKGKNWEICILEMARYLEVPVISILLVGTTISNSQIILETKIL